MRPDQDGLAVLDGSREESAQRFVVAQQPIRELCGPITRRDLVFSSHP